MLIFLKKKGSKEFEFGFLGLIFSKKLNLENFFGFFGAKTLI